MFFTASGLLTFHLPLLFVGSKYVLPLVEMVFMLLLLLLLTTGSINIRIFMLSNEVHL